MSYMLHTSVLTSSNLTFVAHVHVMYNTFLQAQFIRLPVHIRADTD